MKLYRITVKAKHPIERIQKRIFYTVERDREAAKNKMREILKTTHEIDKICYLAESLNFGNTLFVKGDK